MVSDCPKDVKIDPSNADEAGTVLTCTASSNPAAEFMWIEHHNNDTVHYGPTYELKPGNYSLTCVAYINKTCSPGNPTCHAVDSYAYRRQNDAEFPFSLFNFAAPNYDASISCEANDTISGYTVGK